MKKRGATLVIVLVVTAALLIIGTAVSGSVINTMKLNANYSANVDLELAAKSGLSILKNNLIKELSSVNKIENLPNEFEKIATIPVKHCERPANVMTNVKFF